MPANKNMLGAGCLALFGLPFAAAGVFAVWMMLFAPQPRPVPLPVRLIGVGAGLLFACIGFGLIFGSFFAKKKADALDRLKASFPAEPWKWRNDWANGVARSRESSTGVGLWLAAILWNAITFSGVVLSGPDLLRTRDLRGLFFVPFLAVGIGLAIAACRQTIRRVEFGVGALDLAAVPYRAGGQMQATIHARFHTLPDDGVQVRLTCVHRTVSGSGNSRSTNEKILWRDDTKVPSAQIAQGAEGSLIPVSFRVPQDMPETNTENVNDSTFWVLQAAAAVPGVDYRDSFEVPVFGHIEAPVAAAGDGAAVAFAPSPAREPQRHTVSVQPVADGTEFYFPADRNPGAAFGVSIFFAMFGGITYFLVTHRAPLIFPLAFGFFSAILLLIVLFLWLGTSKVNIRGSEVSVHSGLLGIGPTRTFAASDISSLEYAIGMQMGGGDGTPYYDLRLRTQSGQTCTLGSAVKDKAEVEWLLAQMRNALGLKPTSD